MTNRAGRSPALARWQAVGEIPPPHLVTLSQKARARGRMDRPIDTTPTQKRRLGRVDDRISGNCRDVTTDDVDHVDG